VAASLNGAAVSAATGTSTLPGETLEHLGHSSGGGSEWCGHIRRSVRTTDLWDDATLALVSNGYDLPFSLGATAGDLAGAGFTFTRASEARDLQGYVYPANQPRITLGKGLRIEAARTNLVTTSNSFAGFFPFEVTIAAANAADPSGARTAAKLTKTANAFANIAHSGITVTNGSTYAASCYFKAGTLTKAVLRLYDGASIDVGILVNLATSAVTTFSGTPAASGIEAIGSGWYRAWFTAALAGTSTSVYVYPDDPNLTASGDLYAVFAQLELGAFPSTPIVTTGTSATRSVETCIATRSSSLLAQGSLLIEATAAVGGDGATTQHAWIIDDGTGSNRVRCYRSIAYAAGAMAHAAGVVQADLTGGAIAHSVSFRLALRWATNNLALSLNGGALVTDTSATIPTMTAERLGHYIDGSAPFWGHIRRVYRTGDVWSDARLKAASYGAVL
jgi:hypothetical protein